MKRAVLTGALCVVNLVLTASPAGAHPLGNFTINQYLGLYLVPGELTVDLVIDMAEIPTVAEQARLDRDGDGVIGAADRFAYAEETCRGLLDGLGLVADGGRIALVATGASVALLPGQAGLNTLRLECGFRGKLPEGEVQVRFDNSLFEGRLGWREVVVSGQGVAYRTGLPQASVTDRLHTYPEELLQSPLDIRQGWIGIGGEDPQGTLRPLPSGRTPSGPSPRPEGLPVKGWLALAGAFALGLGHAVAPGHGKAAIAAYLVGSRGRLRSGLVLGLAVAVAHTAGVGLVGVVAFAAASKIHPEALFPYLSTASGLVVLAIGLGLGIRRLQHRHHHHHHDDTLPISGRSVVALGLANGMVPSASAILLLLAAVHVGRPAWGLLLTGAFGMGMAVTLSAVGLAASLLAGRGLKWAPRLGHRWERRIQEVLPVAMAVVVIAAGAAMTARGLTQMVG